MAEAQKRFPWWLVVCAVILVPLAAVVSFIETVGRQGTLAGKYDRIQHKDARRAEVISILGPPTGDCGVSFDGSEWCAWQEGPVEVRVSFAEHMPWRRDSLVLGEPVRRRSQKIAAGWFLSWHTRRWAEQAYSAIHGPRRRAAE